MFVGCAAVCQRSVSSFAATWALAATAADPIVGTWVGGGNNAGSDVQFNVRLTFVSPKGGVSRYADVPCGGMLVGDRKGDSYEYAETITFNGPEERDDNYCVNGMMRLSVNGNKMTFDWSGSYNGQDHTASGELQRERGH